MNHKWLDEITLTGNNIELQPLQLYHRDGLLEAAADGELWNLWFTSVPSVSTIDAYLKTASDERDRGESLPFVVVDKESGKILGSTRFCNVVPTHRRLEIGYTWYAKSTQRTGVNTECKLLLLSYAFEKLDCIAVEFRTNWHNHRSRAAILRLGAKQDGVLRNHQIQRDGVLRDTVVFSIIDQEWPAVKLALTS